MANIDPIIEVVEIVNGVLKQTGSDENGGSQGLITD